MKAALLSDIHSNYHAFMACYKDAVTRDAECFIFLGDYISDLSEPQRTMDLIYEIQANYPTICLRGNRERYMLDCESGYSSFSRGSKSGSLLFTYNHLRKKDLDFFRELTFSDTVVIDGVRIELAHAAMENDRYYFDSSDEHITEIFSQMKCDYLLTGHSHKQYILRNAEKTIINPGSVGIPQGGSRNPNYAMLDIINHSISCEFREVPYDIADAIRSQFSSGLMDYAKYWAIGVLYDIITGEERVLKLLQSVQNAGDLYNEEVWHSAAINLGMKLTEHEILDVYQKSVLPTTLYERIETRTPIQKGWSGDKKYCVVTDGGTRYLLRITAPERAERFFSGYLRMQEASKLGISMTIPVEFGQCSEGTYTIHSWIDGVDAERYIPTLPEEKQYAYGVDAGNILKKLHTLPAPVNAIPWAERYNAKIDRKIRMYEECPLKYENGEYFLSFLADNRHLLSNRPQTYQHGDYHIGNMMIDKTGALTIIDFERDDFGDPWEEFNRIVWCAQAAPSFASGMVDAYFSGNIPMDFWKLLALYISANTLSSLPWAIPFGESEIATMQNQSAQILEWYDGMKNVVPAWYRHE